MHFFATRLPGVNAGPRTNTAQLAQLKNKPPAMMGLSQLPKWQGGYDEFLEHGCCRAGAVAHGRAGACIEAYHPSRQSPRGSAAHGPCPPPLSVSAGLVHGVVRDRSWVVLSR